MGSPNTIRFETIVKKAGFLPDGDLLEMGRLVAAEAIKVLSDAGHSAAATALKSHFGFEDAKALSVQQLLRKNGTTA